MEWKEKKKKYHIGYCMAVVIGDDGKNDSWLCKIAAQCDKMMLGIPNEWIVARIFGDNLEYCAQDTRNMLLESGIFDDVLILNADELRYQKIYERIPYDACFYGTEYGISFLEDQKFMIRNQIAFVSLAPESVTSVENGASLRLALENVQRRQKIVLFGAGIYFDIYMKRYAGTSLKYQPAYAVDNDSAKWNKKKNGVKICNPSVLLQEDPENVLIIICTKKTKDIRKQLIEAAKFNYRNLLFLNEVSLLEEFSISIAQEKRYLDRSHKILKILMKEFDRICIKYHLHYYIICGSLIGVIRHKGMIPWDDDIDIAMPRKDFKKLRKIAKKEWSKENEKFVYRDYDDIGAGAFLDCMPRLFYTKERLPTKCFDKVYGKASEDIEDRMFLDIYIMDYAHENAYVHYFTVSAMKGIYNLMMGHRAYVDYDEYRTVIPEKTIHLMKILHKVGRLFPLKFLSFWYNAFSRSGNWNQKAKDYIMPSCAIRCIELKYPREHFGEGRRLPFEDIEVMVPSDYEKQLNAMRYYNYMEYPRMSVQKPSHYFNSDIEIW